MNDAKRGTITVASYVSPKSVESIAEVLRRAGFEVEEKTNPEATSLRLMEYNKFEWWVGHFREDTVLRIETDLREILELTPYGRSSFFDAIFYGHWLGWDKWRTKYCYWFGRFSCCRCTKPKFNRKTLCHLCRP